MINKDNLKIIKNQEELIEGAKNIATTLNKDFSGKDVVWVTVMKGGIMFSIEVFKYLDFKVRFETINSSSYEGFEKVSEPKINYYGQEDFKDKEIVLIDDMIDTGDSIKKIIDYFKQYNPNSISVVSMFTKVGKLEENVKEYIAFDEVPNGFLVGYGLDIKGYYRNLPYIAIIENEDK